MKFVIDRSRWLCGELRNRFRDANIEPPPSRLCDEQDRMCCLGFYAEARGTARDRLRPYLTLRSGFFSYKMSYVVSNDDPIIKWGHGLSTPLDTQLASANDRESMQPSEREMEIGVLFHRIDVEVEFVGEYPTPSRNQP